jgi:Cdc6-like AAA superfamily ATPase
MLSDLGETINGYFNYHQKIILLCILNVARKQKSKKTIDIYELSIYYKKLCENYKIEQVFRNNFIDALKIIETAGLLTIKNNVIRNIGLPGCTRNDLEEAIYQDPEFVKFRDSLT